MGNKRKKHEPSPSENLQAALTACGVDCSIWRASVGYHKGILSGARYASVIVQHLPTGKERRLGFYGAGKAAARREAVVIARRLIQEMQKS